MMEKMLCRGLLVCFAFVVMLMQGEEVLAVNDSFANATSISVNTSVRDNMAYTNSCDYNYYKFIINSPGYISLSFSHAEEESTSEGWNINLYNADREAIKSISSKRSVSNVVSNNIGLPVGTYYVEVNNEYCSKSTIDYQLKVNYVASNSWETEYNDGFLTSDSLTVNQVINGSMMYANNCDCDYYKFTINSPGYISLSFSHAEEESTSEGWNINLYNADREAIKSISSKRSVSNVVSNNIGLPVGTYYVEVNNEYCSKSTIDYQLKVNYVASNSWETEYNDGFLTSDSLTVNQVINGSMMYANNCDYDCYQVILPKSGYINVSFSHAKIESSNRSWNVTVYNSNREYVKTIGVTGYEKSKTIGMMYLNKGTYYVIVDNEYCTKSTIDYQLKVYYTTPKAGIKSATSPSSKKILLKWKKLQGVTGYEIVTATDKKFKKNKKITTISSKNKTKTTIKQLKKGKKYYVKMRGYITVDGKKYYGSYSKTKKVTIR